MSILTERKYDDEYGEYLVDRIWMFLEEVPEVLLEDVDVANYAFVGFMCVISRVDLLDADEDLYHD